jgi:hypothetical protein
MHDLVVRDLEQARNRTLGLTDLDDPTLVAQHDPLMSPLQWREFMADGGYQRQDLWCARGRAHRTGADLERPLFWTADGTGRRFGAEEEVPAPSPCSTSATSRPLERHRSASCAPAAASRASP